MSESTIPDERLGRVDALWRAANYLGAAQIYLKENALLKEKLAPEHLKPRLLGHWGTQPGLSLVYAHLNRLIQDTGASVLLVVGPGHGAPAILANLYIEGSLGEYERELEHGRHGVEKMVRQFSWPYGVPSHLFPGTPGTIHEGGELGYSLTHAFGAALDNPDLLVACVVGDGEAETGPLAAAWHSPKLLDPVGSGAVLPILHLNGYKLSGPTLLARMPDDELLKLFEGYGWAPRLVAGDEPDAVHREMWRTLDDAYSDIRSIQKKARSGGEAGVPRWPMIVLRTPKGWTGPKELEGVPIEGTPRSHQVPITHPWSDDTRMKALESWLLSYRPEELFDDGVPVEDVKSACPEGDRRMGMNPHAVGGNLLADLEVPDFTRYAVEVPSHGSVDAEGTRELAKLIRDVFRANQEQRNFRFFCPDETTSNRMDPVFEATGRAFLQPQVDTDENLARDGRVMEILSEHTCQGWLEGYLLTGRHGLFACYEAFVPIIDSMLNQYAKWLKQSREIAWRKPLASLNYLLTSHVWRQDHNGYTHQVPSFINNVANKKASVSRVYLPPDANCLLSVADHCLRSRDYVNLIVACKQEIPQWLTMDEAREHCARGVSRWAWASTDDDGDPDVVLAAAGDVPNEEALAAAWLLRRELPELRVRMVNVVDLFTLMSHRDHPHGLDEFAFSELFTESKPVIFAFHGYPRLVHELIYHHTNPRRFHVHGYKEEGTTTTPFDMRVKNELSRYHLAIAALSRVDRLRSRGGPVIDRFRQRLEEHRAYIQRYDLDLPEVREWRWDRSDEG